jgi:hypothetical protein
VIQNKNAETVADTIFKEWLCKYGIPAQIHTDAGKEFINKLAAEMMRLINVPHKLHKHIHSAMHKSKFLTRPSRSI